MEDGRTRKQWKIFPAKNRVFSLERANKQIFAQRSVPKSASFAEFSGYFSNRGDHYTILPRGLSTVLALSLLMALILRADDHDLSVSLDDLALVAHGLDRRTYFHCLVLLDCRYDAIRRRGSRIRICCAT